MATTNKPFFEFLGYHIQNINFRREGFENLKEVRITTPISQYDEDSNIYSLALRVEIDFDNSKNNLIEILDGFFINDIAVLKESNINGIFSASLYPYISSIAQSITNDDRLPITLPTIDFRYIDTNKQITFSKD